MIEIALGIIAVPFVLFAICAAIGAAACMLIYAIMFIPTFLTVAVMMANGLQHSHYSLFVIILLITAAINALAVAYGTAEETEEQKQGSFVEQI